VSEEPAFGPAIPVQSIAAERQYLRRLRCACGGRYQLQVQMLMERDGKHYDVLEVQCSRCGASRTLVFDINAFFGREG